MWVVNYELSYEDYDIDNYRDDKVYEKETICNENRQEIINKLVDKVIAENGNEELSILNFKVNNFGLKKYHTHKNYIEIDCVLQPANEPEITEQDIKQHPKYIAKKKEYEDKLQSLSLQAERQAKIIELKSKIRRLESILNEFGSIPQVEIKLSEYNTKLEAIYRHI